MGTPSLGWMVSGFQAVVAVWAWVALVLLHVAWRAAQRQETDPIRPPGPIH